MKKEFSFRTGVYHLNDEPNFNYQLNRTLMWSGGDLDELRLAGGKIKDSSDWETEMVALAGKALSEGRVVHAIAYFRMAEFFMFDGNPRKLEIYRKARTLFYGHYAGIFETGSSPANMFLMKMVNCLYGFPCRRKGLPRT